VVFGVVVFGHFSFAYLKLANIADFLLKMRSRRARMGGRGRDPQAVGHVHLEGGNARKRGLAVWADHANHFPCGYGKRGERGRAGKVRARH